MPDWRQLAGLINFCTAYYTTQLVRCAAISFVLIGLVMLLRKILFSERTFLRGGDAVGIVPDHPVSWKTEAVL